MVTVHTEPGTGSNRLSQNELYFTIIVQATVSRKRLTLHPSLEAKELTFVRQSDGQICPIYVINYSSSLITYQTTWFHDCLFLLINGYIKNRVAHNGIGNQAIILCPDTVYSRLLHVHNLVGCPASALSTVNWYLACVVGHIRVTFDCTPLKLRLQQ